MRDAKDATVIERLYRDHGDRLWRSVYAATGDRGITDDAVAEAFTQALRRGGELRDPLAWIWRAAFRIASGELKERRRRIGFGLSDGYAPPPEIGSLGVSLGTLSPKQRASVILRYYLGYDARTIAGVIGSTPGAVRVHLSVARRRLRSLMEEDDANA